jgi:uncharacterized protein (TIGR02266 family)
VASFSRRSQRAPTQSLAKGYTGSALSKDTRQARRFPLVLAASTGSGTCVTENLSEGGAFLQTDQPFVLGQRVRVRLYFPGLLEPVLVEGVVIWRREATTGVSSGIGLAFEPLESSQQELLARLLAAAGQSDEQEGRGSPGGNGTLRAPIDVSYRILVVEDNTNVAELYGHALRAVGEEGEAGVPVVSFARNGTEALDVLSQGDYDLVLTDLYMPGMDGFTLLSLMRDDPRTVKTKVMVVSGGGAEALRRALDLGADTVAAKPIRIRDILSTVRTLLNLKADLQRN